jgi:hypothetical protein
MGASMREIAQALQVTYETARLDVTLERARLGEEQHALNREEVLADRVRSIDEAKKVLHAIAGSKGEKGIVRVAAAKAVGDLEIKAAKLARIDESKKVSVSGDINLGIGGGKPAAIGAELALGVLTALGAFRREAEGAGLGAGEPEPVRVGPGHDGPGRPEGDSTQVPA